MARTVRFFSAQFPRILLVLALLALAAPASPEEALTVRLVAEPGDDAAGLGLGERLEPTPDRDRMSIDSDGGVLFTGQVRDFSGTIVHVGAIFSDDADGLRAVVVPGDPVPTAGGIFTEGWTVLEVLDARRSIYGNTVVEVRVQDAPFIIPAYLTHVDGVLRAAASEYLYVPGICNLKRLGYFGMNDKRLWFDGYFDKDVCATNDSGLFLRRPGEDVQTIITEGDAVVGLAGATYTGDFFPALVEDDGTVLVRADLVVDSKKQDALVVVDPDTNVPKFAARTGFDVAPYGELVQISSPRIGPRLTPLDDFRFGYMGVTSAIGMKWDPDGITHVFDSAAGPDPILSESGTSDGAYTFWGSTTTGATFQLAYFDRVVVVGETIGPDVTGGQASGVWRYDPAADPKVKLLFWEGGPLKTRTGTAGTVSFIGSVHVNALGRIAAEVTLDGTHSIILEDSTPTAPNSFVVAVQLHDMLPSSGAPVELIGIHPSFPIYPPLTGPGHDGRQCRYNPAGEFLFRGRAVFPGVLATGVWVLAIEDVGPTCDVTVSVSGPNLSIRGDDCATDFVVEAIGPGSFRVTPNVGTTVNGEHDPWEGTAPGNVTISLGGGDDQLLLESTSTLAGDEFGKNLAIDGGPGDDVIETDGLLRVAGSLTLRTGGGDDTIDLARTFVNKNFKYEGGAGTPDVTFFDLNVFGTTSMRNGDGAKSSLSLHECTLWKAKIQGGGGDDVIRLDHCTLGAPIEIDVGTGDRDEVSIEGVRSKNGNVSVSAKKSGFLDLRLDELVTEMGGVKVLTGTKGCDIFMDRCDIWNKATFKFGGTEGATDVNDLTVGGTRFHRSLSVKGKGSHDISVQEGCRLDAGLAINLKGGTDDLVGVADTTIGKGILQVASKGGELEAYLGGTTVESGSIQVKGTKGDDTVDIVDCRASVNVQVITSHGDDKVFVNGTTVGKDLRLGGGNGDDFLENGKSNPNAVSGRTTKSSFETVEE